MGKVFDALEKSAKESASLSSEQSPTKESEKSKQKDISSKIEKSFDVDKNLIALLEPQSFETEQFKMLRTNLLFPVSGTPPRTLMVTSATPSEGKSFVASNLAVSIAQNINEYVLLMDCDMRLPCIHKRFGLGKVPGLSDYLLDNVPLSSLLVKTNINKLTILPGGKPPPNPAELLSSRRMTQLLDDVKKRYNDRYIIIDSPPPLLTSETRAIARQVDGILLVIKYGYTNRKAILNLVEMMGKDKILGVVVNWFGKRAATYYGYGHGYHKYNKYNKNRK